MSKPSCLVCRFFISHRAGINDECHRRSPQVYGQHGNTKWPTTQSYEWCGDFAPKIEESIEKGMYRQ